MSSPSAGAAPMPLTVGLGMRQILDGRAHDIEELGEVAADIDRQHALVAALWTSDRVLGQVPTLEPMALLAYLSSRTARVKLGTAVVVLPARNLVELARLAGTVDHLSAGRLVLGIGAGAPTALAAGGFPARSWGPAYEQALLTVVGLLAGDGATTEAPQCRLDHAIVRPSSLQQPLPVWLSGHAAAALDRAARLAMGWIGSGSAGPDGFERCVKRLHHGLEMQRRAATGFTIAKRVYIHVGHSDGDPAIDAWSQQLFGDVETGRRVVITGSARRCVDELERLVRAGANHLILDLVVWDRGHVDGLVDTVVEPLTRRVS